MADIVPHRDILRNVSEMIDMSKKRLVADFDAHSASHQTTCPTPNASHPTGTETV